MITLKTVNKALAGRGHKAELVKGEGYFYFVGDACDHWFTTSVYVYRLNELTLDQWLDDFEAKKAEDDAKAAR